MKIAREKIGHLHRIAIEVSGENEIKEAIDSGADVLILSDVRGAGAAKELIDSARGLSPSITVEIGGDINLGNVKAFAEAGSDLIRVDALTQSVRAMDISFQIQPG